MGSGGNVDAPIPAETGSLKTVVVTAKRHFVALPDEQVLVQVETALHTDPYFFDEHVTVTIKDSVVRLQGIVFDDWDVGIAMRTARRIPGVRRVVNELKIASNGSD